VTEFQSRRELREAERQGLVPKPEQVFDLPTGQIRVPGTEEAQPAPVAQPEPVAQDLPSVNEMLTRKRIREMERSGLLDPLTGTLSIAPIAEARAYDEVLAETEEPITSSISAVYEPVAPVVSVAQPVRTAPNVPHAPVPPTDIFHSMAVDINARRPKVGLIIGIILVVLAALGAAAYMLGIFK
jgi:hypothetical protein